MKTKYWLVLAATLSTGLMAQVATNTPPAVPPAVPAPAGGAAVLTNAPAPAPAAAPAVNPTPKKSTKKKKAPAPRKSPAAVAAEAALKVTLGVTQLKGDNVNVRGQATIRSEVITKLAKGDTVTVLDEITLEKPAADEPVKWAKIAFPTNGHIWVHTMFVDAKNKTVLPNKLNLRTGPGENFSVVGLLYKGDSVKEVITQGDWMEIEPPAGAYAFIAAQYLKQEAPAEQPSAPPVMAEATPPATPLQDTPVLPEPAIVPAPATPVPVETAAAPSAPAETPAGMPEPAPAPAEPAPEEPPPKRIVQHEGVVRSTWSVQAPTPFALVSPDTGETINYLYTSSTNLNLKRYKGLRIIVTGEEGLDPRWRNTPVIAIQKIHVVD